MMARSTRSTRSQWPLKLPRRECFKLAVKDAAPVLLEPIMNVRIVVPEANMGDILGDLNTRRARVQGMDTEKGRSVVTAQVPLAEMLRYTTDLRSMTGGRGVFTMEFAHYEVVPAHIARRSSPLARKNWRRRRKNKPRRGISIPTILDILVAVQKGQPLFIGILDGLFSAGRSRAAPGMLPIDR